MEICPKCGNYMKFQMEYCCGNPFILYTCTCGYHYPNNDSTTYATSTTAAIDFNSISNNTRG